MIIGVIYILLPMDEFVSVLFNFFHEEHDDTEGSYMETF